MGNSLLLVTCFLCLCACVFVNGTNIVTNTYKCDPCDLFKCRGFLKMDKQCQNQLINGIEIAIMCVSPTSKQFNSDADINKKNTFKFGKDSCPKTEMVLVIPTRFDDFLCLTEVKDTPDPCKSSGVFNPFITQTSSDQNASSTITAKSNTSISGVKSRLMVACRHGDLDTVRCILSQDSVDVNTKWKGRTPGMIAAVNGRMKLLDYLLYQGADLTIKDGDGASILHLASAAGNVGIVRTLIEGQHLDKETPGNKGNTPLLEAARAGKLEVFNYLTKIGCNISATNKHGENSLHLACVSGNLELVKQLLPIFVIESKSNMNSTPVIFAARSGHIDIIDILVKHGCNLEARNKLNQCALDYASELKSNITEHLLDKYDLSTEGRGYNGRTPFLQATCYNNLRVLAVLAHRSCNIHAVDNNGDTALHLAVFFKLYGIVKELIEAYDLDVNVRGQSQGTPLFPAVYNGDRKMFNFLLVKGANLRAKDKYGNNVLHVACRKGNADIAKAILSQRQLNVNDRGHLKRSAVMMAARYGHLKAFEMLLDVDANLDTVDSRGNSLFHLVCMGGNVDIVKKLIKMNRHHNIRNRYNVTPFQLASKRIKSLLIRSK